MNKDNNEERFEKKNVQEMKDKVFGTKNEKERKKHYTKYILAKERLRAREKRVKDNKIEVEETDHGDRTK